MLDGAPLIYRHDSPGLMASCDRSGIAVGPPKLRQFVGGDRAEWSQRKNC